MNNPQRRRIVFGIDPGSGIKSPTGFAAFDPDRKEIYIATNIVTRMKELPHRLKDISDQVEQRLLQIIEGAEFDEHLVFIESFVMRGKGGETLQRLIGAFLSKTPYLVSVEHVQNSTIKKQLAGHGHADKISVAQGTMDFFASNADSVTVIKNFIKKQELDILDALAIGVAGWQNTKNR